ncbi:MAG: hypothetical protein Ct9H300mP28_30180 [Pseudomonadota bacterium]|nr:MAG: hypothetical protein Ct9H300mP28_30180 [Pseudomonadota bacterium]
MKEKIASLLTQDLAIDLGTANTLVYTKQRGIVIREPLLWEYKKTAGAYSGTCSWRGSKADVGRTPVQ